MTENDLKELGWKFVKQYDHDTYNTNRYQLGCMEIEFTYLHGELVARELTITELNCIPVNLKQAKILTQLFTEGHE